MRLLWIPHTRWFQGVGHRARYLIDRIRKKHEVHVITWSEPETPSPWHFANPAVHLKALLPLELDEDEVTIHQVPRWCLHRLPHLWRRNQQFMDETVRRIVRENAIDTIAFGPSAHLVGYPPIDTGANLVFDYVDYLDDRPLLEYLRRADAITCASQALLNQVRRLGRDGTHIPNGVDLKKLHQANGGRIRKRYGIEDSLVISLIGLTCSPDLYFAESLFRVHRTIPKAAFLLVGKGEMYRPLRRALRSIQDACVWTGWIPRDWIYDFFLASDIGLYPGAANPYFRAACPIKLLEYEAAGKPAVCSPVEEVDALGLRNAIQVEATADAFYTGIQQALGLMGGTTAHSVPSWEALVPEFEAVLSGS